MKTTWILALTLASACTRSQRVTREQFGKLPDGGSVELFTLTNRHGIEVRAMTYGAIITSIRTPDRHGTSADIVLGFDSLGGYLAGSPYFGAVVGRYANRIAGGRFTLDGVTYRLARNNGPNTLHGGTRGFDKVLWSAQPFQTDSTSGVVFQYESRDGEEGYPGTLQVKTTYALTDDNELDIEYEAVTDKATPINLSQHTYWNLHGDGRGDILDHVLTLNASAYTPVDSTLIPTGKLSSVDGTPFDFRKPTAIGARIDANDEQLRRAGGYDHSFVVRRSGPGLVHAAQLVEPTTGRTLDVWTTEPGVQVYTGNFLDGTITGKDGRKYARRGAICLETAHFPDTPNHPSFPSAVLRPGQEFTSRTVFAFGVRRRP